MEGLGLDLIAGISRLLGHAVRLAPEYRDPIITASVLYFARQANRIVQSIKALNGNVVKIIERVDSHELRISAIEVSRKQSP